MTIFLLNKIIFCVILSIFSVSYSLNLHSYAIQLDDFLYPVDSNPFGRQFKEWLADWWKFNLAIPAKDHPYPGDAYTLRDNTKDPSKCFVGEDKVNNVLFLGVPPTEIHKAVRTCDVPAGKSIFLPFASGESDSGLKKTEDQIRYDATIGSVGAKAAITLDGVKSDYQVEKNRVTTDLFNMTYNNTVFEPIPELKSDSGKYQALADGYTLFLKPLPVGNHTLSYETSREYPVEPNLNYVQEMTYYLIVK